MVKKGITYLVLCGQIISHLVYAGGSWSAPQQISATNKSSSDIKLSYNGSTQQVFATWSSFPGAHPMYATYSPASGWSSVASIANQAAVGNINATYDSSTQQVFATWTNSPTSHPTVAMYTPSVGWNSPTTIDTSTAASDVTVAYDPGTQQVFAAWSNTASSFSPTSAIYNNTSWSVLPITDDLANLGDVSLVNIGNTGDMIAGYGADNGSDQPAFIDYIPGLQWSGSFYLNSTVNGSISFVYDAQLDKVIAVWADNNHHPTYAIFTLNVGWTTPTTITTASTTGYVSIAYQSSTGIVFAAWADSNTSYPMYATYTPSTGWSAPSTITTASQIPEGNVNLTCDTNTQQIIATWPDNNSFLIWSVFGISTVSGISIQQKVNNLGVAREYFNHLTWNNNSSIDNVLGYYIYRSGTLIATVTGNTTEYKDHNRKQNESVTYSIVAYNGQGQQSNTAYITMS